MRGIPRHLVAMMVHPPFYRAGAAHSTYGGPIYPIRGQQPHRTTCRVSYCCSKRGNSTIVGGKHPEIFIVHCCRTKIVDSFKVIRVVSYVANEARKKRRRFVRIDRCLFSLLLCLCCCALLLSVSRHKAKAAPLSIGVAVAVADAKATTPGELEHRAPGSLSCRFVPTTFIAGRDTLLVDQTRCISFCIGIVYTNDSFYLPWGERLGPCGPLPPSSRVCPQARVWGAPASLPSSRGHPSRLAPPEGPGGAILLPSPPCRLLLLFRGGGYER